LTHRFIQLWRRIFNNKANEKQKQKFAELEEKLTSEQKSEVDQKVEQIKTQIAEKENKKAKRAERKQNKNLKKIETPLLEWEWESDWVIYKYVCELLIICICL